ncbi:adenylyl-sulfate kinase [Desulfonatronovibrio hydrogenovorans]|uniref:adenylyl-sulfate kinase n=1 Tax=Desulfonatronovibrio hydrogenovorans TaxID=53245 RepID=UPI00048A6433|nr:adenylyl-sulfate kinase [Desulfonatronovibrio hydrogenovorans]
MVIWLVGLSGSGKTTIGKMLYSELKNKNPATVFLDGDILRDVWGDAVGHDVRGRSLNAHRISHLCRMLDSQSIDVVAAVLSIFPEWQIWNRNNFSIYVEFFLDTPMEILKDRDTKGLYKDAEDGLIKNVVGVDIPFPVPKNSDMVVDTSGRSGTPKTSLKQIVEYLETL